MSEHKHPRLEVLETLQRARSAATSKSRHLPIWDHPARADILYRHVLEQMHAMLIETDYEGRIVDVSDSAEAITGYTREEFVGQTAGFSTHVDDLNEISKLSQNITDGPPAHVLSRFKHKRGHWIWLETGSACPFRAPDGTTHTVFFSRDATETKLAADALRDSEERYRVISNVSRDLVSETDESGVVTYVSPNTAEVIGMRIEDAVQLEPFSRIHPEDVERVRGAFHDAVSARETVLIDPYRIRMVDGSWRWIETRGVSYQRAEGERRFLALSRDVTKNLEREKERRELEEHIQQAQRLESLGIMAGGIAHDFNNLLTPILGAASLALMDLPKDSPVRRRLARIQRAGHRAAALTNQMLAYAGAESLEMESIALSDLVEEMRQLLESAISGKTALSYALLHRLPTVNGDSAQLGQVLMNLVANATEAVGDGEGQIIVRTGTVELEPGKTPKPLVGSPGKGLHVFFEIEDTGHGMDAATRARIFDPFFTTKFTGRGLGLAAALGIVKSHGGAIEIDTEPSRGSRFRVLLPAASGPRVIAYERNDEKGLVGTAFSRLP